MSKKASTIEQETPRFRGGQPQYLIRHVTFRQMQIFESIVRLGSFTRAAEELFLTQPTVSTQFKKLADTFDIPLLDQSGRQLRVTEAGNEVYHAIRTIFDAMAELDIRISELKGLRRGRLRLGVISTATYFAPEILGEFCRKYPEVDVSLQVANREQMHVRLHNNEDDLYILGRPPEDMNVEAFVFGQNPLVVIASRKHPLCGEKNISLERIAKEPFISREPGSGIRDTVMQIFSERGLTPNIRMQFSSNEAIKHSVVGELGIAVLSLHTLSLESPDGPVTVLDVEGFPIYRKWYLVHLKDKKLSTIAKEFMTFALASEQASTEKLECLYERFCQSHSPKAGG